MTLKQNIDALVRGELGVEAVKEQLLDDITDSPVEAAHALQALHEEREKGALTQQHYDELTQFVSNTVITSSSAKPSLATAESAANDPIGDPPNPDDASTSMARPATEPTKDSAGNIDTVVDIGMILRDRFILDKVIGIGGMGTVYLGRDLVLVKYKDRNPYVAVKILNDSFKQRPDASIALQRDAADVGRER